MEVTSSADREQKGEKVVDQNDVFGVLFQNFGHVINHLSTTSGSPMLLGKIRDCKDIEQLSHLFKIGHRPHLHE